MTNIKQHLHIGAGALGLGLICWLTHRAGMRVVVANREASNSPSSIHRHRILRQALVYDIVDRDHIRESIKIDDFVFFDSEESKFSEIACSPETLLITTSLRDERAIDNIAPILARALVRRAQSGIPPVYIIACENTFLSKQLKHALEKHDGDLKGYASLFIYLECVVDRICNEPKIDDKENLVIRVEKFSNWVIEQEASQTMRLREALSPVTKECVNFVDDVSIYKKRKLWLVNGTHLLICIYLYNRLSLTDMGQPIPVLFSCIPESKEILEFILDEASDMFCTVVHSNAGEVKKFAKKVEDRFICESDTIERVLKDFSEPTTSDPLALEKFMRKVYIRIISLCEESGTVPFVISQIIEMLLKMIHDRRYLPTSIAYRN